MTGWSTTIARVLLIVAIGAFIANALVMRSSSRVSAQAELLPQRFYIESVDQVGQFQTIFVVHDAAMGKCHAILENKYGSTHVMEAWDVACQHR